MEQVNVIKPFKWSPDGFTIHEVEIGEQELPEQAIGYARQLDALQEPNNKSVPAAPKNKARTPAPGQKAESE